MKFKISNRQLAAWSGKLVKKYQRIKPAAASTLNYVGDKTVAAMARQVADQTGLSEEEVRKHFVVKRATTSSLRFEIDASRALTQGTAARPMRGKRGQMEARDRSFFREGQMVNVIDMGDDRVCEVCEAMVEGGPYTIEQARAMIPAHPNCRCVVEPVRGARRSAQTEMRQRPTFRSRSSESDVPEAMGELLGRMRQELRQAMRK